MSLIFLILSLSKDEENRSGSRLCKGLLAGYHRAPHHRRNGSIPGMGRQAREPITGPCAWHGEELARSGAWRRPFRSEWIDEIDAALDRVEAAGLDLRDITRENFPLEGFAAELARMAEEIENGIGFARLSGFPVGRYSEERLRKLYWGIGRHLGTARSQTIKGEIIGEVRDEVRAYGRAGPMLTARDGSAFPSSRARARSNAALRFHTDRTDAISLLCVRPARAGGVHRIASTVAVHNEILRRRPDLLELLYQDYPRSRLGEEQGGEAAFYMLPVFGLRDGKFTSHYSRTFVEASQELADAPRLSDAQWEALDLLAEVAGELCLEAPFETGDLQLINCHVTYHARTSYEDHDEPGRDRLLLRLWLSMPNSRPLPAGHEVLWGAIEPGALRGGIGAAGG
jgi:hypothetical protein